MVWVRTKGVQACLIGPLFPTLWLLSGDLVAMFLACTAHLAQAAPVARHKIQALLHRRAGEPGGSGWVVGAAELPALRAPAQLAGMVSLFDFVCGCQSPREHIAFGNTR